MNGEAHTLHTYIHCTHLLLYDLNNVRMNKSFKGADLLYKNALNATSAAETLSSLKQSLTVIKVLVK